ncbi:Hypothetical predicted protein, partial [Pelobates cultripes]
MEVEMYQLQRTLINNEHRKEVQPHTLKNPFKVKYTSKIKTSSNSIKTFMQVLKKDSERIIRKPLDHRQNLTK